MQSSPQIEQVRRRRVIQRLVVELASSNPDDAGYEHKLTRLGKRIAYRPAEPLHRPPGRRARPGVTAAGDAWSTALERRLKRGWQRQKARLIWIGGVLLRVFRGVVGSRVRSASAGCTGVTSPAIAPAGLQADGSGMATDPAAARSGRRIGRVVGQFTEGVCGVGAARRSYMLYEPAFRASGRAPLLVMLHGCNQSAEDFAAGTRMNEVAEDAGVVVLYPEQAASANAMRCWNWYALQDTSNAEGDAALVAVMTREVMRDQDIDPSRVYVAGMSAGGAMAAVLARDYPRLFAALGVHSGVAAGLAHDAFSAMRLMSSGPEARRDDDGCLPPGQDVTAVASIVFHGDADGTVHPSNAEALYAVPGASGPLRLTGASTTSVPPARGLHGFTRSADFGPGGVTFRELWMVHGAGHAWTGGSGEQRHTDACGPDASREMMRFFLQHRLPG